MKKIIHPQIGRDFGGRTKLPAELSKEVMQSLDGITAKVMGRERDVFLAKDFGYVWCFMHRGVFEDSLLSRIQNGNWKSLSFLAKHPSAQDIIFDLRAAYNSNPIKFVYLNYSNPFYESCVIGDPIFAREPQKDIDIYLAVEGGNRMAESFEKIFEKYKVKI